MPTNVNMQLTALIAVITARLHPELTSENEWREDVCKGDLTRCWIFNLVESTERFTVLFFALLAEGLFMYRRMFLFGIDLTCCSVGKKFLWHLTYFKRVNLLINRCTCFTQKRWTSVSHWCFYCVRICNFFFLPKNKKDASKMPQEHYCCHGVAAITGRMESCTRNTEYQMPCVNSEEKCKFTDAKANMSFLHPDSRVTPFWCTHILIHSPSLLNVWGRHESWLCVFCF